MIADCGELVGSDRVEPDASASVQSLLADAPGGDVEEVSVRRGSARRSGDSSRPQDLGLPTQFGRPAKRKPKQQQPNTSDFIDSSSSHPLQPQIDRALKRRRQLQQHNASKAAAESGGVAPPAASTGDQPVGKKRSKVEQRLFELRMRMNQGRKANKQVCTGCTHGADCR